MNWGLICGIGNIVFLVGACIGYALAKDVRKAMYFGLAAAITATVVWP